MYTPINPNFTIQEWDVRGFTLHGHVSMMRRKLTVEVSSRHYCILDKFKRNILNKWDTNNRGQIVCRYFFYFLNSIRPFIATPTPSSPLICLHNEVNKKYENRSTIMKTSARVSLEYNIFSRKKYMEGNALASRKMFSIFSSPEPKAHR